MKSSLIVISPKPFDEVGAEFTISGVVPLSWLNYGSGFSNSISLELLDTTGKTGMGTSIPVPRVNWLARILRRMPYGVKFSFDNYFNYHFIKTSQGRVVIRLSGQNEKEQSVFIPLIVKELEPVGG